MAFFPQDISSKLGYSPGSSAFSDGLINDRQIHKKQTINDRLMKSFERPLNPGT